MHRGVQPFLSWVKRNVLCVLQFSVNMFTHTPTTVRWRKDITDQVFFQRSPSTLKGSCTKVPGDPTKFDWCWALFFFNLTRWLSAGSAAQQPSQLCSQVAQPALQLSDPASLAAKWPSQPCSPVARAGPARPVSPVQHPGSPGARCPNGHGACRG